MECKIITVSMYAILAGVSIGFGGLLFSLTKWGAYELNKRYNTDDWALVGQIVGSCVFSVGLLLVCWLKLMLFTGKVGLMFEGNQDAFYFVSLLIMLVFNVVGAVCVGLLSNWIFGRFAGYNEVMKTISTTKAKFEDPEAFVKCFINSLLCGMCVHLAVRGFNSCETGYEKNIIVVWFVAVFVYNGFEHCIANSFYFACAHLLTRDVIINIVLAIIGNWFGTLPTSILTTKLKPITNTTNNNNRVSDESSSDDDSDENSSTSSNDVIYGYNV